MHDSYLKTSQPKLSNLWVCDLHVYNYNFICLYFIYNNGGILMSLWWIPILVGTAGFVSLLMIIILHLIEEYRNDRF